MERGRAMLTLNTLGNPVEITYTNGHKVTFEKIKAFIYRPGLLIFVWNTLTIIRVENPANSYSHICCPGRFELDIE